MSKNSTTSNMSLALAAAKEFAEESNPARLYQIKDNIDGWVGYWADRPSKAPAMRWPEAVCDAAGLRADHGRRPRETDKRA